MKEQLPLKRILIGLVICSVTAVSVTVPGMIKEKAPLSARTASIYAATTGNSAYAPVRALNHEENKETISILNSVNNEATQTSLPVITEEVQVTETEAVTSESETYEVTEWWKAELSDYNETLEQEELVPSEVTESEPVSEEEIDDEEEIDEEDTKNDAKAQKDKDKSKDKDTTKDKDTAKENVALESKPVTNTSIPPAQASKLPENLEANTFYFTSYGWGHGVGLSQNGANFYATYAGYDYLQILQHYYPGTTVMYTPGAESERISVRGYSGGVLDIISMVCNAEVGSSFDVEAIKAQAVAAYTYIKYAGGSTSGMAIKENPDQKIIDAVRSVIGQAVYYDGDFALTQFYASSGGTTASCKDVFYEDIPYLRSVTCDYDAAYDPHYGDVVSMSVDTLRYKIQAAYGIYLSSDYSSWIQLIEGDGGYIADVVIDGQKTVDGYEFARTLGIKSGKFTVLYT